MHYRYILLSVLLSVCRLCAANGDSIVLKKTVWRGDLSGSYVTERNWWGDEQQFITFKGLAEARYRKKLSGGRQHEHYFHTQLGYAAYPDSVWIKDADLVRVQLKWMGKGRYGAMQTWSVRFQTQWLSTWGYSEGTRAWKAGFMNPAKLEAGYAYSWDFLKNSNLMLNPATLQVNIQPATSVVTNEPEAPAIRGKHANLYSRYGFSAVLSIEETFCDNVILLSHQSHFFFNAISPRHMQFDLYNRICFRFLKYLQIRLETTLGYLPEQSLKLQYRQEVLLGIFYEKRK
ncbi:MAG: hypothetical protein U0Y08_12010 [Bacteroidia bacterium]